MTEIGHILVHDLWILPQCRLGDGRSSSGFMAEGDRGSEEGVLLLLVSSGPLLLCLPLQTFMLNSDASQFSRNLLHGQASVREEGNALSRGQRLRAGCLRLDGLPLRCDAMETKNTSERHRDLSDRWKPLTLLVENGKPASHRWKPGTAGGSIQESTYTWKSIDAGALVYVQGKPEKRKAR